MTLMRYKITLGYCTRCLEIAHEKKSRTEVNLDYCIKIGNTNLCSYHLNEAMKELDGYIRTKS